MIVNVLIGQLWNSRMPKIDAGCEWASYKKEPKLKCLWRFCQFEQDPFCAFKLSISLRISGKLPLKTCSCLALPVPWFTFYCGWVIVVQFLPVLKTTQRLVGRMAEGVMQPEWRLGGSLGELACLQLMKDLSTATWIRLPSVWCSSCIPECLLRPECQPNAWPLLSRAPQ